MSRESTLQKSSMAIAVGLALQGLTSTAWANNDALLLEEVIVTAQKREQSLQDVPVSVSVVTGDAISETGMTNLDELSTHVPNLSIQEGSQTTAITMRGLGSGINQGFEQSVGMFIDGIYAGRDRQFRSPFLDVAAVEVLRGPQGTLFGKNTIAGAINLTTAKPTDEFEASLRTTYEPEYNEYSVEGIVSGGITDNLYGRLAVKQAEGDGYMENTFTDRDEASKVETVVRGTLVWEPTDELSVTTKYETARYDVGGENSAIDTSGGWGQIYALTDPAYDEGDEFSRSTDKEFSDNDNESLTVTVEYDIGEYTLTSITGYSAYDYNDLQDVDFAPIELLGLQQEQDFEQWSQEIRLTSPIGEKFDFITGLYFQTSDLEHHKRLDSDLGAIVQGVPFTGSINGIDVPINPANVADLLEAATFVNTGSGNVPTNKSASIIAAANNGARSSRVSDFEQESETWAIFGQGTWHVRDDVHLTLGLRWTKETKEADRRLYITEYGTENPLPVTDPNYALLTAIQNNIFSTFEHDIEDENTVYNFSPSFKAQYDLNDDVMLYASVSKAFKSGGFDEAGTTGILDDFSYDDEEALSFEVGGKMSVLDGRGSVNFAVFHTNYEDLQVSAFVGDKYVVGNAAEATSQGVEVDGVFRLTEALTMTASMAYLDATYDKFDNASCTLAQIQSSGATANDCAQDLKGETLAFAPEWTANIGLNHVTSLSDALELTSMLNLNYTDEQYLAQDLDDQALEESHVTVNGRIALTDLENNWELALVGKNLTDEEIRTYSNDTPLMDGAFFTYMAPPRTVAVQFTLSY
ncbi:TonB-dependent receptor [Maricurvus nonylphenolicus]|uniref:TonB-dependent receptor n=1 Tax=Maricurvus nonylphenolicus TaxID=1008307 RepID=UPI0036F37249